MLLQPGITPLFITDGRHRAVTRVNDRLIREGKEHALDTVEELLPAPAGQISAANAPIKEHVAVEQHTFLRLIEADVSRRVARRVEDMEAQIADR